MDIKTPSASLLIPSQHIKRSFRKKSNLITFVYFQETRVTRPGGYHGNGLSPVDGPLVTLNTKVA